MVGKRYRTEARRRWGKKAEWVTGDGQFALLAWCRVLTVTLWETRAEAEKQKAIIDKYACGGYCTRNHEIIDLAETDRAFAEPR